VNARAARVWQHRYRSELEAAQRFQWLSAELALRGCSEPIVALASRAARDELTHAKLCRELVEHFGGTIGGHAPSTTSPVAPEHWPRDERLLYELVAMSCVTETLSTALLGALVERASDELTRRTMHAILRDEVGHSQLGWAYLAEQRRKGVRDCIGQHLPAMLAATVGPDLFRPTLLADPLAEELSGLGSMDRESSRRVVCETLESVIFPGLERFGIDVAPGRRWLAGGLTRVVTEVASSA